MTKYIKLAIGVLLSLTLAAATQAKDHNIRFQSLTISDGLPSQSVYETYQQRNGFIWFATNRGAIRYDGKAFKSFYFSPGSPNHITNNFVLQTLEDHQGNIWFATEYGLNKVKRDGKIEHYLHDASKSDSINSSWIYFIYQDSSHRIWVGTNEGLNLYQAETNNFIHIDGRTKGESNNIAVFTMLEISQDYFILGTKQGLVSFTPSQLKLVIESEQSIETPDWYESPILVLKPSRTGRVLIGTVDAGLIDFNPQTQEFEQYKVKLDSASIIDNKVDSIVERPNGEIFLSHFNSGLTLISSDRQSFTRISAKDFDETSLLSNEVIHLFLDQSGLLWVSTMHGVSKHSFLENGSTLIQKQADGLGLSGKLAFNTAPVDDNHILIATSGGLNKLRISDGKTEQIDLLTNKSKGQLNSQILDIDKDSQGNFWIAGASGLQQYNPQTGKVTHYFDTEDNEWGLQGSELYTVAVDLNDGIWVTGGVGVGLAKFSPENGVVERFLADPLHPYTKGGNYTSDKLVSSTGDIWLATTDGVYRVNPELGIEQHVSIGIDNTENIRVAGIVEDKDGTIWAASQGMGLVKLTIDKNNSVKAKNFTTKEGLISNELLTVSVYKEQLWLSSKDKLFSYDTKSQKSTVYPSLLNLPGMNFEGGTQTLVGDSLYLGTNKGLAIINLSEIASNQYNVPVQITQVQSDGVSLVLALDPNDQRKSYIAHKNNNLSFSFAALDFTHPKANGYRYFLEGFDKKWVDAGNKTNITYNSLSAGTYTFKVMATNSDGKWSDDLATFTFEIERPWWFYVLYLLAALLTLALLLFIFNRRLHVKSLYKKANYDSLTGVANRYYFNKTIEKLSADTENVFTLIIVDLDGFKEVNDVYGHAVGDELLIQVAARMKNTLRDDDLLARLGGDEFAIIIYKENQFGGLINICERLRQTLESDYQLTNHKVRVSASIGASSFPNDTTDKDALLIYADTAMFAAKQSGKNVVRFFNEALSEELEKRTELKQKLQTAIKNEEFELYYQPQIDQFSNKVVGFEALIRWFQADGTAIAPNFFIQEAERNGSIVEIGKWVLFTACKQACAWQEQGLSFGKVSVNVSVTQITKSDLVSDIEKALLQNNLAPEYIEIEITESVLVDNIDFTIETLKKLRALGVSIALDDFGTGYSSLNYLTKFPIDTLKIDKSFVQSIETDMATKMVLKNIYTLANDLSMKVVAEGVETHAQLQILANLKGRIIQGYYYSPALTKEDATTLLNLHRT